MAGKKSYRNILLWLIAGVLLLSAGGIYTLYLARPIEYVPFLTERLNDEIDRMQQEAGRLAETYANAEEILFGTAPPDLKYRHYIYRNATVVYWSDYRYIPEYTDFKASEPLQYISTPHHDLLILTRTIPETQMLLVSVLSLANRYEIENKYLESGINDELFGTTEVSITSGDEGSPVCIGENCLFNVVISTPMYHARWARTALILFWLALFLVTGLVVAWAWRTTRNNLAGGIAGLAAYLVITRALLLIVDFPQGVFSTNLFDSRYFASSALNPSLGDLILNLVFVLVFLLVVFFSLRPITRALKSRSSGVNRVIRFMVAAILAGAILMTFHFQFLFLQTLYNNSQLSFDINDTIRFDLLRIAGYGVFVVNAFIAFLAFHCVLSCLISVWSRPVWIPFAAGAAAFAAVNLGLGQSFVIPLVTGLVFTGVILYTRLYSELAVIRYRTFLYVFTGIVATAVLGSLTVQHFELIREKNMKIRFANQFLIENDNLAEYLLAEAVNDIAQDALIQSRMSSPFMSKDIIRTKIRQFYLSNYFDKYDVSIHLYNPRYEPYDIPSVYSPREIEGWRTSEYVTPYDNIYFLNQLDGQPTKRYVTLIPVRRRGLSVGFVVIDLSLKRIIPDNVYPELLVDSRFLLPYEHAELSYAIIDGRRITYNAGDFNYHKNFNPDLLDDGMLYSNGMDRMSYNHLAVRDERGKVVIISSREHPVIHIVSNFSFLFLLFISLIVVISGIYAAYFFFRNIDLTYSVKIQLYLNLSFFLPLIAVSLTTLSVINSSYRKELEEEYLRKAENISQNISINLEDYRQIRSVDPESLGSQINLNLIGKVVGVDVNLFSSTTGRILATNQPLIYENELLSNYINPVAIAEIRENGESYYVATESVGSLTYSNTFLGIKSYESGELLGILSIPFFQSAYELERSQIDVLTNVMNIFTAIFIIFLAISSLASSWLTFPLRLITQRLKKTTLTGTNEPLAWKTDDEIGLMVREYNRMLENMEQSKKALARNQKETAWREIAQQVAHEIKNPLTPMKLTLQHLSRRFANGRDELNKSINSLLAQVDTLSDIASSFSSFAKLPIPEQERFELTAVLRNTAALFDASEELVLTSKIPDEPIYSIGDEQLMGRIFSNILLNAIQAHEGDRPRVDITMNIVGKEKAMIEIKDHGTGIEEHIRSKVFIPNFTTKESGSGIGLAVAKHGVEHAGGKIWFETEKDAGTSFYIEMPVVP